MTATEFPIHIAPATWMEIARAMELRSRVASTSGAITAELRPVEVERAGSEMVRKKRRTSEPTDEHWYFAVEGWGFGYLLHLHDVREQRKYGRGFEQLHLIIRATMMSPHPREGSGLELLLFADGKRMEEMAEGTMACGSVSKRRDRVLEALVSVNPAAFHAIELALAAGRIKEASLGVRDFRRSKGLVYSVGISSKETDQEDR